jgi:ankyrin repeat protein
VNDTPGAPTNHVADVVDEFQSSVSSLHRLSNKHRLSDEQRKTIKDSLQFKQRDARLLTLKQAQTKTCQWLLKNSKYTDWMHADKIQQHRGFFWIKGKPGSGKSIMMKFLFSHAKKTMRGSIVLSFFFNARGETLEKTTTGLYRALVLQLLEKAPQTWTAFEDDDDLDARLNLIRQSGWEDEVLRQIFVRCLQKLENKRVVCFVDALDECPEAAIRDMISLFEEIGEMDSTAEFRVCFSSRHYPEISIRTGLQLVLEGEAQHIDDITLYIDANLKIDNHPQLEDIRAELLRKASGIFLWVHLVIPELNKEYDSGRIKALKKRLSQIPSGLHELFLDMLTRDQRRLGHFRLCVEIILYALRPLLPSEFRIAVEAHGEPSTFGYDDDSMTPDNLRKFVLDCLKGLAEITKSNVPTVQWIHESVRDFFLRDDGLSRLRNYEEISHDLPITLSGHSIFVDLCLRQLSFVTAPYDVSNLKYLHHQLPFLSYTTLFVFQHANEAHKASQDQALFLEQFKPYGQLWLHLKHSLLANDDADHILYYLSEYGADELIRLHPDTFSHFHLKGGIYGLPLLAALYANQNEAARALLDLPPKPDKCNGRTELTSRPNFVLKKHKYRTTRNVPSYLCEYGDVDLLQRALSTMYTKENWGTLAVPLLYVYAASEAIVDVLAAFELSRFTPSYNFERLSFPQSSSYPDANASLPHLKRLLRKYPGTNSFIWPKDDLLVYAASRGFNRIIELCIKDSDTPRREKAFMATISSQVNAHGRLAVLKQLFDAGLDLDHRRVDIKDAMFGMIPIPNNEDLVKIVLTKVEWFLEAKSSDGLTPLLWALYHGRKAYVKLFLDAGANPMARAPDNGRPNALMLSIKLADVTSFDRLLTHPDCDKYARDDYGRTALSWCAMMAGGEQTAIGMIQGLTREACGDFSVQDKSGRTALMRAVESASEEAVEVLLPYTIHPDSGASNRSTPLRLSIIRYIETQHDVFLRISRVLLSCGADFYCTKKLPTPADIIARYDESICADLRQIWEISRIPPVDSDIS